METNRCCLKKEETEGVKWVEEMDIESERILGKLKNVFDSKRPFFQFRFCDFGVGGFGCCFFFSVRQPSLGRGV